MAAYQIALVNARGEWDVVETFEADDDQAANAAVARYVQEYHPGWVNDWFVLDSEGRNINGDATE